MDIDKLFYRRILKNLFSVPCTIKYWDGSEEKYGQGDSRFKLIFNEPLSKSDFLMDPTMVFGEGYMFKKIELEGNLQELLESLYNNPNGFLRKNGNALKALKNVSNTTKKSKDNIEYHYDIGNDFYKLWLDDTMTYSCGYFKSVQDSITVAQKNKVDHILRKLCLKENQTLLDIGCGWGELIIAAAKKYGVKATGITLSKEQFNKVSERIKKEGLDNLVEVQLIDYREFKGRKFDRVLSVGMAEHLGKDHVGEYFEIINKLLNNNGVSLLHVITSLNEDQSSNWITKYIFPGGYLPSVKELVANMSQQQFNLIDVESLRRHYAKTLIIWAENFENAMPEIRKTKDEVFIRMWRLYLNNFAANFKTGFLDIHQFVFTKGINDELPLTRDIGTNCP